MLTSWFQSSITPAPGVWQGVITGVAGTTTAGAAGTVIGYNRPNWYDSNAVVGTIATDLFVDRRNPATPKTIRMMGIVQQGTSYVVIGWKLEPSITPTTAMPSMQGSLRIFGRVFPLSSGARPGVQSGYDGLYWNTSNLGMVQGQPFSFEFS